MKTLSDRFHEKYVPVTESGCWLWDASFNRNGYGQFAISINGKRITVGSHRVSWELRNGKIPEGMHVLHKCDVRACVNPDHLFIGTHLDNIKDRLSKNRPKTGSRGELNHHAKLTNEDVLFIRDNYTGTVASATMLANKYKIHKNTVFSIVSRRTWYSV